MSSDDLFGGEMSYIAYGYRLPHPDSKTHQLLLPPPEPLNAGGPEETGTAGPARIPASLTSLLLSVRSVCGSWALSPQAACFSPFSLFT